VAVHIGIFLRKAPQSGVQSSTERYKGPLADLVNLGVHNTTHKPVGRVFALWITHIPQETLSFILTI
jgi:hypothetical protein